MSRLKILAIVLTATIGISCLFAVYLVLDDLTDRIAVAEGGLEKSEDRSDENAEAAAANAAEAEALAEQLRGLGQVPVVDPEDIGTPSGGADGPSLDFVRTLVNLAVPTGVESFCAPRNDCTAPPSPPAPPLPPLPPIEPRDGRDGVDGETPSDERLVALIAPLIPAPIPGKDGVGVLSFACTTPAPVEFTFTVALTDGTTQTFTCGGLPADPDPEPTT